MTNARFPRHGRAPRRSATTRYRGVLGLRTHRRLNIERLEKRDLLAIMTGFPMAAGGSHLPLTVVYGPAGGRDDAPSS